MWSVFGIPIRAYALCIVAGIIVAGWVTDVRLRRRGAPPYMVLDIAVWAVPAGIIGARIYHVLTTPEPYFGAGGHPLDAFKIWNGGLGIWGAVAGGALGAWIACRRIGIPLSMVADALAPGLPLAQAIGRWGNWFNNELYGRATTLPWGLRVHEWAGGHAKVGPDGKPLTLPGLYHPTFLYESLWDVGVAILVLLADRRYKFGRGRAFALYVMAYTVGRAWVESLRVDTAEHFLGMRLNVFTSVIVFVGALIYFVRVRGPRQRMVVDEDGKITIVPDVDGAGTAAATEPAASGEPVVGSSESDVAAGSAESDAAPGNGPPAGDRSAAEVPNEGRQAGKA